MAIVKHSKFLNANQPFLAHKTSTQENGEARKRPKEAFRSDWEDQAQGKEKNP
jgi:hypothetical protein